MTFLYIVIALVIIFDFINGFHDSANSIAAVVSTKVLSPIAAVSMAAFLISSHSLYSPWRWPIQWEKELWIRSSEPYSYSLSPGCCHNMESDNLVVGFSFQFVAYTCRRACRCRNSSFRRRISCHGRFDENNSLYLHSPLLGMTLSFLVSNFVVFICRKLTPFKIDKIFRRLQLLSSASFSLGHGGNDARSRWGLYGWHWLLRDWQLPTIRLRCG